MGNAYVDATGAWSLDGTIETIESAPVTITKVFFYPGIKAHILSLTDALGNELFSLTAGDTYFETMSLDFTREHGGGRKVPSLAVGVLTAGSTAAIWLKKTEYKTTKAGL